MGHGMELSLFMRLCINTKWAGMFAWDHTSARLTPSPSKTHTNPTPHKPPMGPRKPRPQEAPGGGRQKSGSRPHIQNHWCSVCEYNGIGRVTHPLLVYSSDSIQTLQICTGICPKYDPNPRHTHWYLLRTRPKPWKSPLVCENVLPL